MKISKKNYLGIDVSKPWFDVSLLTELNHVKQPMRCVLTTLHRV